MSYWVPTASCTGCACWRRHLRSSRRRRPHRAPRSAGRHWGDSGGRSPCRTRAGRILRAALDTPSPPPATRKGGGGHSKSDIDYDGAWYDVGCGGVSVSLCSHGNRCRRMNTGLQEPADKWRRCSRGPHIPDQSEHSSTSTGRTA